MEKIQEALRKKALGYRVTETVLLEAGKIATIEREVPPDTLACYILLRQAEPEKWGAILDEDILIELLKGCNG